MNIKLLAVGKTDHAPLQQLISDYQKRLSYYVSFSFEIIPNLKNSKNTTTNQQKEKEGVLIINKLKPTDVVVLLDEKGEQLDSIAFSKQLQRFMNSGIKTLVFIIGGPYGFSTAVTQRARYKLALSKMTFSHQMVRLFFIEQIYRGFTILKNEPYHHR